MPSEPRSNRPLIFRSPKDAVGQRWAREFVGSQGLREFLDHVRSVLPAWEIAGMSPAQHAETQTSERAITEPAPGTRRAPVSQTGPPCTPPIAARMRVTPGRR